LVLSRHVEKQLEDFQSVKQFSKKEGISIQKATQIAGVDFKKSLTTLKSLFPGDNESTAEVDRLLQVFTTASK